MVSRTALIGLALALAAMVAAVVVECSARPQSVQPFASSCGADDEISAKERAAVDQVALDFVKNALGPHPESAYSVFTADAKTNVDSEKFVRMFKTNIQTMGPFKDLHVAHTYLARVMGAARNSG